MTWHIMKKEFFQNIITSRFIIGTVIYILFTVIVEIVLLDEHRMLVMSYNEKVHKNDERLKDFHVYSRITSGDLKKYHSMLIETKEIVRDRMKSGKSLVEIKAEGLPAK